MVRIAAALIALLLIGTAAHAAPALSPGTGNEFAVELPSELRKVAGRGELSAVSHALVTIGVPANFDPARSWPVLVVSATSDAGHRSSRALLRAYADDALASGWVVVAADPKEDIPEAQDDVPLRVALNAAALAVLKSRWAEGANAPLAFAGFSGGAKYACWLAAASAREGRSVIGLYLAGINEETLVPAAAHFGVMVDSFRRVPVFLQAGAQDKIAPADDHREIAAALKRAGFGRVRVEVTPGGHAVESLPLPTALNWFREASSAAGLRPSP